MNYKINFQSQDYLEHHGILGQRWGHRNGPPYPLDSEDHSSSEKKAGWKKSLDKSSPTYSFEQKRRDQKVYGSGGARRIERSVKKGDNVSGARSSEAARINSTRKTAQIMGNVGSIAGAIGGVIGAKYLREILSRSISSDVVNDPAVALAITSGTALAGKALGRIGAQSITMAAAGYSPSKYR